MPRLDPDDYDVREVPCPSCGAPTGAYCRRPSGHSGPFVAPHAARRHAAYEAWRAEERGRFGRVVSDFLQGAPPPASATVQGDLFGRAA